MNYQRDPADYIIVGMFITAIILIIVCDLVNH